MRLLLQLIFVMASLAPQIKILTHKDCQYSLALKILLDYSKAEYEELDVGSHMDMLKSDNHIPKLYLNGKLIGGYQDSLKSWEYIFKTLPERPEKLKNPDYVNSTYGRVNIPGLAMNMESK